MTHALPLPARWAGPHAAGPQDLPGLAPQTTPAGGGLPVSPAWAGGPDAPIHFVVNSAAGSAMRLGQWALFGRSSLGRHRLYWHRCTQAKDLPVVARRSAWAARQDGGVVVAMGGDGTINTVAQFCWSNGLPMGVMAGGTFNAFARQEGLATDLDEALAAIVGAVDEARWRALQVGLVNGQVFLVNTSLGLYPRLLAEREAASHRWGRSRSVALAAAARSLLSPFPAARYRLAWHGAEARHACVERLEATTLFVGNNAMQLARVGLSDTDAVGSGALQAVSLAPASRWGMGRLLWRAASGSLASDPAIESRTFTRLVVDREDRPRGAPVRVAYDGERGTMRLPLQIEVGARPLWLAGAAVAEPAMAAEPVTGDGLVRRPAALVAGSAGVAA